MLVRDENWIVFVDLKVILHIKITEIKDNDIIIVDLREKEKSKKLVKRASSLTQKPFDATNYWIEYQLFFFWIVWWV